jgi:3-keto-L-gulonate-6-phosphate decarboxylase
MILAKPNMKLDNKTRYLQIAFNYDLSMVLGLLPLIPHSDRIFIEAGTPFIKNEGRQGIATIARLWRGIVVADLKVVDGAANEVQMARAAGARAATAAGNSPIETLDLFVSTCKQLDMISMIDMINVSDPLSVLRKLKRASDVVILHRGRDEETTRGKVIEYRHVNRIRSKFDCSISAAGGVDLHEARSAVFNGANIIVANIVRPGDPWVGISTADNIPALAKEFLNTIE